jgi:hypothetical protein
MVNLGKFIHTYNGQIIMSILLGFGFASLFRKVCNNTNCITFLGPSIEKIKNKIFQYDNKCYSYSYKTTNCPRNDVNVFSFEKKN